MKSGLFLIVLLSIAFSSTCIASDDWSLPKRIPVYQQSEEIDWLFKEWDLIALDISAPEQHPIYHVILYYCEETAYCLSVGCMMIPNEGPARLASSAWKDLMGFDVQGNDGYGYLRAQNRKDNTQGYMVARSWFEMLHLVKKATDTPSVYFTDMFTDEELATYHTGHSPLGNKLQLIKTACGIERG